MKKTFFDLFLIGSTFMVGLLYTWGKWPDPFVDFGVSVYDAWRLFEGDKLYSEVPYHFGPLAIYWYVLAFKIFGVSLNSIFIANALIALLTALLLYFTALKLGGRIPALISTVLFLFFFCFGAYSLNTNYNFLSPYKPEATIGLFLLLLQNVCVLYLHDRNIKFGFSILTGLCFLTSTEVTLVAAMIWVSFICQPNAPVRRKELIYSAVLLLLPSICSIFWGTFKYGSLGDATEAFLVPYRRVLEYQKSGLLQNPYLRWVRGTDNPILNAGICLFWFGFWAGTFWLYSKVQVRFKSPIFKCLSLGGISLIGLFPISVETLPYFFLGLSLFWFFRDIRAWKHLDGSGFRLAIFCILSVGLLFRLGLRPRFFQYGFTLLLPATIFSLLLGVRYPNSWFRAGVIGFSIALSVQGAVRSLEIYSRKNWVIPLGADAMVSFSPEFESSGVLLGNVLEYLRTDRDGIKEFVSLPEHLMLNFLERKRSAVILDLYRDLFSDAGEVALLEQFRKIRPKLVLVFRRNFEEYGCGVFGEKNACGGRLQDFLESFYVLDREFKIGSVRAAAAYRLK